MITAALALIGFFVSLYLWLWKLGLMGPLVCSTGGCETVQLSEYAVFFGVPVALWGVLGFTSVFVVSIAGLQSPWLEKRGPTVVLTVLSAIGVGFVGYLTYLEAAVIRAWCQWCIVCALLVTIIFLVSLSALRTWPVAQSEA
jgi:uncharacterized membrane protein